ncbi:BUD13 homolog [Anthonomus grandis grandis]|uniref:BUD13 homolog n=1 Tax=Anthonomus grandis grandis TaxID=2921223 RepID=UPI002165FD52|nr:BUD13 homolog [Anthonomus grandis grandis]
MSVINQKEYLKKYLGIGKGSGEKKKKKKSKQTPGQGKGLKIVDDDIDVNLNEEIKVDLAGDNEDAPQIVSVIDERPPSLRIDEKTQSKLWLPLGASEEASVDKNITLGGSFKITANTTNKVLKQESHKSKSSIMQTKDHSPKSHVKIKKEPIDSYSSERKRESSDDNSPPRRRQDKLAEDMSPPRRSRHSPPTKSKNDFDSRKIKEDNLKIKKEPIDSYSPGRRKESGDDNSPPRRRQDKSREDMSPPRRSRPSPPTKSKNDFESRRIRENNSKIKKEPIDSYSPKRRRKSSDDNSPPRRRQEKSAEDMSPPRKSRHSPPRKNNFDSRKIREDNSPPRKKKSRWGADSEEENHKMQKTLDGKRAGLQNATDLAQETLALKQREDALFKNLSAEVSGANAATIVRGKKKEVDWEEEEKRRKKEAENKEKYERWGKGLKQVEDVNEKIQSDLHEMSKPLARYADDEDLEKYLKDQEREGDPMLAYLRQKKRKKDIEEGKPMKQKYQGDAPPNRFGIWPGYRWDGVDRSNGYEKQWFQVQNSKKASIEETYKWSTEDM